MGFLEKLAPKGAFDLSTYTVAQLRELEANGSDVSQYLPAAIEREKKAAELAENRYRLRTEPDFKPTIELPNRAPFDKYEALASKPFDPNSELIKDVDAKPWLFGKKKWADRVANAKLAYAAIVQCSDVVWDPAGEIDGAEGAWVVHVRCTDDGYERNLSLLKQTVAALHRMRDEDKAPKSLSGKMKKLYKALNDPSSTPDIALDESFWKTYEVNVDGKRIEDLKHVEVHTNFWGGNSKAEWCLKNSLPDDGILPLYVGTENIWNFIPTKFW